MYRLMHAKSYLGLRKFTANLSFIAPTKKVPISDHIKKNVRRATSAKNNKHTATSLEVLKKIQPDLLWSL